LQKLKIKLNLILDETRPTTNKNVIISGQYRLLKIDKVDNRGIPDEITAKLKKFLENTKSDAVIFSDFRHGIFHQRSIRKLVSSIPKKVFKCADSQVASRWGNITEFENFDLTTPNERECRFALADQDSTVGKLSYISPFSLKR
jgi:bifunctional ADP-heptose synthase (sugar kinase/adenylyltransferase)